MKKPSTHQRWLPEHCTTASAVKTWDEAGYTETILVASAGYDKGLKDTRYSFLPHQFCHNYFWQKRRWTKSHSISGWSHDIRRSLQLCFREPIRLAPELPSGLTSREITMGWLLLPAPQQLSVYDANPKIRTCWGVPEAIFVRAQTDSNCNFGRLS